MGGSGSLVPAMTLVAILLIKPPLHAAVTISLAPERPLPAVNLGPGPKRQPLSVQVVSSSIPSNQPLFHLLTAAKIPDNSRPTCSFCPKSLRTFIFRHRRGFGWSSRRHSARQMGKARDRDGYLPWADSIRTALEHIWSRARSRTGPCPGYGRRRQEARKR